MIDHCVMCGKHIPKDWDDVCPHCVIENHKVRESYLLQALTLIAREREELYLRVVNENRCEYCAHRKECLAQKGPSTMRSRNRTGEDSFCARWTFDGHMTSSSELVRRGRLYVEELRAGKMTLGKDVEAK